MHVDVATAMAPTGLAAAAASAARMLAGAEEALHEAFERLDAIGRDGDGDLALCAGGISGCWFLCMAHI